MDPNHWGNYNQYGRLASGSLSTPHSAFPLLDQAGLSSSLGLTHTLQPHAPLPQRALSSLPSINYAPHPALHSSTMSQIIESMAPLTSSFNPQSLHKGMTLAQNSLVFDSMRGEQQIPVSSSRFSSASTAVFSPSKSSLFAEEHPVKEPPHAYSSPSVLAQNTVLESGTKGWGLSNFMPPPSTNPFGAISSMDLSGTMPISSASHRSSQPPPAHSSGSRHSAIQRNLFSPDGLLAETTSRARVDLTPPSTTPSPQVHSIYNMMGLRQQSHSTPAPAPVLSQQHLDFHGLHSHAEIEDLSSGSQPHQMYYSMSTSSFTPPTSTNTTSFSSSQLSATDINYDPVSPATPLSDNQSGDTAFPSTVSFADLNAIGASGHHHSSKARGVIQGGHPSISLSDPKEVPQHLHALMMPQPASHRGSSKSQVQQMTGSVNSPHQHSPISVGSPQAPMSSIGSPQNAMPSSTVKPSAPPVQAMADSSTTAKVKKPRSRKKPKAEILKNVPPPLSSFGNGNTPAFLSSSHGFAGNSFQQHQPRVVPQFQPPDNQTLLQTQFGGSTSSPSPQAVMRMRSSGSMGEGMGNDGGSYQVMSGVQQVSPISEQSPRSQQQQRVETPTLLPLSNATGRSSSSDNSLKGTGASEPMLSGAYQDEPELMGQQGNQFDLQPFSSQPYMEQLVSAQPPAHIRLIPGNVYSEAMHVAAGMPVFPASYASYTGTAENSSTIDEAAFSSLFDNSASNKDSQGILDNSLVELEPPAPPSKPSATCTANIEEDEELCYFSRPPTDSQEEKITSPFKSNFSNGISLASGGVSGMVVPGNGGSNSNSSDQRLEAKPARPCAKQSPGFQDSFLSFLMGKKQETLSSVTSATISEKPQLPKYIPEPRRPPPPRENPPSQESTAQSSSPISFSDDDDAEDSNSNVDSAVKHALSNLGPESEDSDTSDVTEPGYSVEHTKDLTVKITLQNPLKKQNKSRGRPRGRGSLGTIGRGKGRGSADNATPGSKSGQREPTPPPPRESIGRRAKDVAKEKTSKKKKKHSDSDASDEDFGTSCKRYKVRGRSSESGSESAYDSDKDPVWTPFAEEGPKRPPTFTFDPLPPVESRSKKGRGKGGRRSSRGRVQRFEHASVTAVKVGGNTEPPNANSTSSHDTDKATVETLPVEEEPVEDENFQVGRFLIEKKDLHNYESYPVWRLEQGRMLRKFELYFDNGRILHKAVSTYSSWVPIMRAQFVPIRVLVLTSRPVTEVVEVLEEYRPKPPTDGSLEVQYEDDPLVEHFNIYLQIFLSQSLEPSFLAAIRKSQELFYLLPLEKIDKMIDHKLEQIDHIVQWKPKFRECMRMKPQMREINRPNLKQSCQACENSSPPTIKSVLFHGAPYDHFLLTDLAGADNTTTAEFLVGKTAACYINQYHNLHHFKYRLYQRCRAKVHMVRESNKSQNIKDESILDQCLQNRAWVLKIFEDFKALLER